MHRPTSSAHTSSSQCLANLTQQRTDGGRAEYLEQERRSTGTEPEVPTGDCAVAALVHATFRPPTGHSYRRAIQDLTMSIRPQMYEVRQKDEKLSEFLYRRLRQWIRPPNRNPIHATPSLATGSWITNILRYEHIYPNKENSWHCICDMMCTYVLDVQLSLGHTMTVHQRVAYTTSPFHPDETEVVNVHRLNAERTAYLKASRRYEEAQDIWFQQWAEGDRLQLLNWEGRPKLDDFLKS